MKVLISTTSFAELDRSPLEMLERAGCVVEMNPYRRKLQENEAIDLLREVEALVAGTESLSRNVLSSAKNLKVISRCGTGMENVDFKTAEELGIKVFNTPGAPTKAVAELTVGLILNSLRLISKSDRDIRKGNWKKPMGYLLSGKMVGIIGLGRIGKEVAGLLKGFGVGLIAYDKEKITGVAEVKMVALDKLLKEADIVSLHLPALEGKPLVNAEFIASMKKGAFLINTSRGELVDEEALYDGLSSGKLAGAAIDTFSKEPYDGKLKELDNIVMTAHIGSYARETRIMMETQAVENLLKGMGVK